jgi:uncharacterized membrane protein
MDFLLLVALLVLAGYTWRLANRVVTLEAQVRDGEADRWLHARIAEPRVEPARAVRRAPLPAAGPDSGPEPVRPPRSVLLDLAPPAPAEQVAEAPRETLGGLFERLVGGSLLIWIGGIALALAGLFLVRYSIQIGLITPGLRMLMATAFGLVLIAAGEMARRRADSVIDPRMGQALVGAGVLVLYAAAYGSHVLYGLVGMRTASVLMIGVTAAALVLALRHGAPAAVMGLVGGFLTPLLVGNPTETSVPLLTYLALLNAALFALAARRGWTWFAASAVLLSFCWTGFLAFLPPGQALPAGVFILVLSLAASLLRAGGGWHLDFLRPAAIGLAQLSILVARTDLGITAWALFAALAAATFFLAPRRAEYRPLPAFALGLALALLLLKALSPQPEPLLPWIAGGIALLFAVCALPGALRGRDRVFAAAIACLSIFGPLLILRLIEPALLARSAWGLLFAAAALVPLFLAWRRGGEKERDEADAILVLSSGTAIVLLAAAAWDLVPRDLVASAWLALALLAGLASRRLTDRGLGSLALASAVLAVMWAATIVPELWGTAIASLLGDPALAASLPTPARTLLVLGLPVPLLILLWRSAPAGGWTGPVPLAVAALFAGACAYVLFKQLFALSSGADFIASGVAERTLINQALFLLGWLVCSGRLPIPRLGEAQRRTFGLALTALAAARLFWFDMAFHNPVLVAQDVGALPVLNLLLPAYLLSAFWLYKARRAADSDTRSGLWLSLFLLALVTGTMLMVRQGFHGAILSGPGLSAGESYGYSLAGLLLSIALLLAGIRLPDKALRVAGLGLLTATIFKVFLVDAAALEGLLRILSFLGLGVALIGIGKLYAAVLRAEAPAVPTSGRS